MMKKHTHETDYEKQCFMRMLHMMEQEKPGMKFMDGLESGGLDSLKSQPLHRLNLRAEHSQKRHSRRLQQRNSWMASSTTAASMASTQKPLPRSTSADSKKPKISCDVSNLQVVGTRTHFNNTRASTPESADSGLASGLSSGLPSNKALMIKQPLRESQENLKPTKSSQRLSRSRQILKELQRQVREMWRLKMVSLGFRRGRAGLCCSCCSSSSLVLFQAKMHKSSNNFFKIKQLFFERKVESWFSIYVFVDYCRGKIHIFLASLSDLLCREVSTRKSSFDIQNLL